MHEERGSKNSSGKDIERSVGGERERKEESEKVSKRGDKEYSGAG